MIELYAIAYNSTMLLRGRVVVIAHTELGDEVRFIVMREGTKHEQIIFFQSLSN